MMDYTEGYWRMREKVERLEAEVEKAIADHAEWQRVAEAHQKQKWAAEAEVTALKQAVLQWLGAGAMDRMPQADRNALQDILGVPK